MSFYSTCMTHAHTYGWIVVLPSSTCGTRTDSLLREHRLALQHGQHFTSSVGDEERVFKLRRALAIDGGGGPVVGPQHVLPGALIDHWLDRKDVSSLHRAHRLVLGVMRNGGRAMKQSTGW